MNSSSVGKKRKAMSELKFADHKDCFSQQTIVKMLRGVNYRFEPITEYGNEQFYCVTECKETNKIKDLLLRLGIKVKYKTFEGRLGLLMCGKYCDQIIEPMVFTRDDVQRILMDVPGRYVGPSVL